MLGCRKVSSGGWIIDRDDIKSDRVGRGIQIDAAIGGAAVVAHLEGEGGAGAGAGAAVGVGSWREGEGGKVGGFDLLASGDSSSAKPQGACARQAGDDHALQAVGP